MHRTLALNIVHIPAGQTKGTSVAFDRAVRRAAEPVRMEFEVRLAEGDDLAFELDTNATGGGGGAAYLDMDLQIGWFGE
jgi:hypothetical protein